jgi:hypothetical protein
VNGLTGWDKVGQIFFGGTGRILIVFNGLGVGQAIRWNRLWGTPREQDGLLGGSRGEIDRASGVWISAGCVWLGLGYGFFRNIFDFEKCASPAVQRQEVIALA